MAWFSFSKFKQCNNAAVHEAVKAGIEASNRSCIGAYYVFNESTLVISFIKSVSRGNDYAGYESAIAETKNRLPEEFKNAEFWERDRFTNECPEKVKNATGYVSVYTPELNKI